MHVVVVGAGVFGAWIAHHLHARGATVTLVDAYGAANSRSSSGDDTRIVRCGYGRDAIYSELARQSRAEWKVLDERFDVGNDGRNAGEHRFVDGNRQAFLERRADEYIERG